MKKFGRKLFLSCAALAACATTLVSTTFAWYTSNTEVKATNISATSSNSVDASSIYIANPTGYTSNFPTAVGNYGSYVDPTAVSTTQLEPVYYNTSDNTYKKLKEVGADKTTITYDTEVKGDVLEYYIFISTLNAASSATAIYLSSFTFENTIGTAALPTLPAGNVEAGTGIEAAGDFGVDIRKAIKMNYTATQITTSATTVPTESTTVKVCDLGKLGTYKTDVNIAKDNSNNPQPNAVGYYNKMTGNNIAVPGEDYYSAGSDVTTVAAGSGSAIATIDKDSYGVMLHFVFYLDGWDEYCYDVCRKQGIKVAMTFTTSDSASTIKFA